MLFLTLFNCRIATKLNGINIFSSFSRQSSVMKSVMLRARRNFFSFNIDHCFASLLFTDLITNEYQRYTNKRLTTVMYSVKTLSRIQCVTLCSNTDGCYAVNVIRNSDVNCELTTGLSNQTAMVDDATSNLYVNGNVASLSILQHNRLDHSPL